MDKQSETYKALDSFRKSVIKQSRSNLTRMKKNSSKSLYNSLKSNLKVSRNSFELDFEMLPYGQFQDKGVSGVKKKYNTPFTYRDKMPPASKLDKWIIKKGIAPRGEGGKFVTRKQLQFAIARKIYNYGIKPSLFFTKPFEKEFKKLDKDIVKSFGLDLNNLLDFTLENLK
jgi:hypothetical protein